MSEEQSSNDEGREIQKPKSTGGQIGRERMTQDEIAKEAQRVIDES